jgi:hypothetical protein
MTRTAARTLPRRSDSDLDGWLLGEPDLDADGLTLLAAYRDAASAARAATVAQPAPETADPAGEDAPADSPVSRGLPPVLRLRTVDGVAADRLGDLHGRLLAAGYLTAELLGRTDGLAYRVTREGLRRLSGETVEAEAA